MELDCCLPGSESPDTELLNQRQDPTSGNFPNVLASTQGTERGVTQWRLHERLYCAVCQLFLEEPCWLHAKSIPNESVVPFALASLPNILCLDACTNSSTGKKVLAKHSIPPQTIFGPLVAATAEIRKESTVYAFPSPEDGQLRFFQLDSELFSNWMRYVRFAENPAEENLAVYLRGSQVVFVSLRAIFPGEELKVGYSAKYARTVGSANAQIDKQEFDDFCVTGLESVEHNENAYPQVETCSSINTAGLDCVSLVPGNEGNFLPDPPISASTLPGNPLPGSAVRTNLDDAPLVSLFEPSGSDEMNKNHACEKTGPTPCTHATDNLSTHQQVQPTVPGPWKRKRGQRRKMDTVNKEDGQETLKQKRSRLGKEQVLERRGDIPSAAEHTEDYTNSSVHAPPVPTSNKANNLRVDTDGSAAKCIDIPPVEAKTVRENSPEIAYHPPVRKTASPNEEQHSAGAEIVCRRSTLRSARKAAVPPVETPTVPGLNNCDPGDEVELMGTGKGLGIDSDSDWAAEDGVVSDEDNDEQESDEDICDMHTDRKSRQSNGRCPRITKAVRKGQSCINKVPNSNRNDLLPVQKGRPLSQRKSDEKECPVCHLVTSRLNQHLNREHPDNAARLLQHPCATCGMRYHSLERLRTHMTVSHPTRGEKPTAESRQTAIEYMQKTGRLSYFCVKCSRYFLSKPVLDIHELGCHRALEDDLERTERKCPACDFSGTSFGQLALHTANHAIKASERKQCLLCAEQIFVLPMHYQRNHPEYREIVSKDWQFECQQCGEKFVSQPNLDTHTRKHEKFQCIYCAVQLENTEAFTEHLSEHQKDGCFPCPVCPRIFPQYAEFREHFRCEHDAKSVLVCEVCQVVCRDRGRLKEHVQTHNKDYRFPCNQCRQRFHTERNLRRHVRKQHEGNLSNKPTGASRTRRQREFEECPVCHRAVQKLDAHLNRKHPEDADKYLQHACTTCGMRYHSAHSLHIHVTRFHPARGEEPTAESRQVAIEYMQKTGRLSYYCPRCSRYFPSKSVLDIHELCCHCVVEDHQTRPERQCPACDFMGTNFAELAMHTADHAIKSSERKQCLLCAKQVSILLTHYQKNHPEYRETVSKDWLFECQQCAEKFLTQHTLDTHMRSHGKIQCIYCALQFENLNSLSRHMPAHQKDGSFPCPVCPRTFPQYAKFREHYRCKHDAKSVLVCEVCQAVCRSSVRLNVHMQSHKKDYRFPCTQCGKRFHAERYLRGHIRWVHEGNLKEYKKNYYAKRKEKEKQGLVEAYKDPRRKFAFEDFPYKCRECKLGYVRRSKLMHHVKAKHPDTDPHSVPL